MLTTDLLKYAAGVSRAPVEFVRLPTFERSADGLLTEADVLETELVLMTNPEAGDLIPSGRGLRQLRRPLKGRGKRGGARVIYYLVTHNHRILLMAAYSKNEKENLSFEELRHLADLAHRELR